MRSDISSTTSIDEIIQFMKDDTLVRSVHRILSGRRSIHVTRRLKPGGSRSEFVVTIGSLNHVARRAWKKAACGQVIISFYKRGCK